MNDVIKTIAARRSIRNYTAQPVSPEQLDILLQCAINAPSARNLQPRYFTVLERPDEDSRAGRWHCPLSGYGAASP
ncbi:MAG: nitroreductase family protein [Clostridia bacterium]